MVGEAPACCVRLGVTSLLQVGCPARRIRSWGQAHPLAVPVPCQGPASCLGMDRQSVDPRPGLHTYAGLTGSCSL